jgi:hypothetical protein
LDGLEGFDWMLMGRRRRRGRSPILIGLNGNKVEYGLNLNGTNQNIEYRPDCPALELGQPHPIPGLHPVDFVHSSHYFHFAFEPAQSCLTLLHKSLTMPNAVPDNRDIR